MLVKNKEDLNKNSLLRRDLLEVIEAGLQSLQAQEIVKEKISLNKNLLEVNGSVVDLDNFANIYLIGFGKGSLELGQAIEAFLENWLAKSLILDVKTGPLKKGTSLKGDHPLPSKRNLENTKKVISLVEKAGPQDLIIFLVLGGGSCLLCAPTVPLSKWREMNESLIKSGSPIEEINKQRKEYSKVKGGKLARMSRASVLSLIVSDVPGNDLTTIASSPTVISSTTNILLADNRLALNAMEIKAEELGYDAGILSDRIEGEARKIGGILLKRITNKKSMTLAGGETTVDVKGDGKGGRNQELVLGALDSLVKPGLTAAVKPGLTIASLASDGWDNCKAAGAIGDELTLKRAKKIGLDLDDFLKRNDAFHFFEKTGDLLYTKRGLNVSDLILVGSR